MEAIEWQEHRTCRCGVSLKQWPISPMSKTIAPCFCCRGAAAKLVDNLVAKDKDNANIRTEINYMFVVIWSQKMPQILISPQHLARMEGGPMRSGETHQCLISINATYMDRAVTVRLHEYWNKIIPQKACIILVKIRVIYIKCKLHLLGFKCKFCQWPLFVSCELTRRVEI